MTAILTRDEMRAFDRYAIETFGVPSLVLMENAGHEAAARIAARLRPCPGKVVVVCGNGNNGGDGFVVARHLATRGIPVVAVLIAPADRLTPDAGVNYTCFVRLGGRCVSLLHAADLPAFATDLGDAQIVVDAIFGTGLDRAVEGHPALVIRTMLECCKPIVALDVPSGLDADRGVPLGLCVRAEETITFGQLKTGLATPSGVAHAGKIHVVDLGIPADPILSRIGPRAKAIDGQALGARISSRAPGTHKVEAGHVAIVGGSAGKLGAAQLAGLGALRTGAGLVTVCSTMDAAASFGPEIPELMTARIDVGDPVGSVGRVLAGKRSIVLGPGLGLDEHARNIASAVLQGAEGPVVVDADAITLFAGRSEELKHARGPLILTPHAGELSRLLNSTSAAIEGDRFGAVRAAAHATGAIVVLKGARTLVATPEGQVHVCLSGNPALATGGTGDVLAGIIAALALSLWPIDAARAGVLLHAEAGDLWQERNQSDRGLLATSLASLVPEVLGRLIRGGEGSKTGGPA